MGPTGGVLAKGVAGVSCVTVVCEPLFGLVVRSGVFPVDGGKCNWPEAGWKERTAPFKDTRSMAQSLGHVCSS